MGKCRCRECMHNRRVSHEYHQPLRRWAVDVALDRFYRERWLPARDAIVEKAIADILGHAREHTAIVEVPPRHAMSQHVGLLGLGNAFAGVDRSVDPRPLQRVSCEPITLETLHEATLRIAAMVPPPPVRPWISRERAEELIRHGCSRRLVEATFDIY